MEVDKQNMELNEERNETDCPNVHYPSSDLDKTQRVFSCLKNHEYPLSPNTIANKTEIKSSTVRTICSRLCKEGSIESTSFGHYTVPKSIYGMYNDEIGFENITLIYISNRVDIISSTVEKNLGLLKLQITFGATRNKVSSKISYNSEYKKSLTFREVVTCSYVFADEIRSKLGVEVSLDEIYIRNIESNNDIIAHRFEGITTITMTLFRKEMEKFYLKHNPEILRFENRPLSSSFSVTDLINSMLSGAMYTDLCKQNRIIADRISDLSKKQNKCLELNKVNLNILRDNRNSITKIESVFVNFKSLDSFKDLVS